MKKEKENKSYVAYRCLLCNEVVMMEMPENIPQTSNKDFCNAVLRNQLFFGNPALHQAPMHMIHNCKDGSCGVAQFAGIKVL